MKKYRLNLDDIEEVNYAPRKRHTHTHNHSQDNYKSVNILCSPQEIKYIEKNVFLSVYDPNKLQTIDIPMNCINNIVQIKKKVKPTGKSKKVYTVVTFRLKDDLAKRYKLRDWEKIDKIDKNGDITVSNTGEDMQTLLIRLFKYGKSCVILSPKYLRKKLMKLVEKTLKNYE